jgi:SHS2 domain-containing protein
MAKRYRIFGTTADLGVISWGKDLKEAFENQAAGMFAAMVDLRGVRPRQRLTLETKGIDDERLLFKFLGELLFIFDAKRMFLRRFEITSMGKGGLKAEVLGEPVDLTRHTVRTPIKAVTYHMLAVKRIDGGYSTRVIYDI